MLANHKAAMTSLRNQPSCVGSRACCPVALCMPSVSGRVALHCITGSRRRQGCSSAARRSERRLALVPACAAATEAPKKYSCPGVNVDQVNVVYKFGGSSVRDAERMKEVADIICSFPQYLPCVVLSAMGKTTNMLLESGDLALKTTPEHIKELPPLREIHKLHLATCEQLQVEPATRAEVERLLKELEQLLTGISIMQDLTQRAKDSLVSFGERLATRVFASYLRTQGIPARQYDAWDLGMTTTDNFTNAEVMYDESLPKIKDSLSRKPGSPKEIPVVTGFLGRGKLTGAITTLGRGGSDLTATVLGAALELKEVQVWKDVDGVLTSDPRIVANTSPVNELTFEEATELAYFGAQVLHPLAMQPAIKSGKMAVRVKNSYNRNATGTVITLNRDMSNVLVTSIVVKKDVTLVDITSTRMLGQYGFLATVFEIFRKLKVSVDVVATSEVSVSLTLDPKKMWTGDEEAHDELEHLMYEFKNVANAEYHQGMSIISLICNVQKTSEILCRVFEVLQSEGINVVMMSQGASKTNISLVVNGKDALPAVKALHLSFFENKHPVNFTTRTTN